MFRLLQYYARYQSARGSIGGLPGWAKFLLLIVALPGIVGLLLSGLALCVSLAALLLLTVPTYRLLNALVGGGRGEEEAPRGPTEFVEPAEGEPVEPGFIPTTVVTSPTDEPHRPRRQIDVKIVE